MANGPCKFGVGDTIRANQYEPNGYYRVSSGDEFVVESVDLSGMHIRYMARRVPSYGHDGVIYNFTGSYFDLVQASDAPPPAPPKTFDEMTKEELAEKVVEVARRLAKRHNWCPVVDQGLKEMGLGRFIKVKKKLTVTAEVSADATPEEVREALLAELRALDTATATSA